MDYDFKTDLYGEPEARFSMGHEAIGRYFSEHLGRSRARIDALLLTLAQQQNSHREQTLSDVEFELRLSRERVAVHTLASQAAEHAEHRAGDSHDVDGNGFGDEQLDYFDDEQWAECGLPDFQQALEAWRQFVVRN